MLIPKKCKILSNPMQEKKISQTLLLLAEALEQLALIIAREEGENIAGTPKELEVLSGKRKSGNKSKPASYSREEIRRKFKKGFIKNWLLERDITVGKGIDTLKVDKKLYEVADYLADHYLELEDFYKQLKRHQGLKKDFVFKTPRRSVLYIRKWVMMLFQNKIIDAYKFLDNEHIDVDIKQIHDATWFIQGFWLEIFLRSELAQLMRAYLPYIKTFDILAQAHLVFPGDFSSEIDLLLMLNDKVYWFECKSGNIGEYYKKFKKEKHLMKLPMNHSFLVMPDMDANRDLAVKKQAEMTPLHADNIDKELKKHIFDKLTTNSTH